MTCIVGIVDRGHVVLAGDSAGVAGLDITVRRDPKVFRVGEFVIGYTSSFRMGQLLRFGVEPPDPIPDVDPFEYMVRAFVPHVREAFKAGGYAKVENGVEEGGHFLVGLRGRLFQVEGDFQVGEPSLKFDAIGCGQSYALGCLLNASGSVRRRAFNALETADTFSAGVCAPYVWASTRGVAESWPQELEP